MERVCSQYGGARMQESYRPTGAKNARVGRCNPKGGFRAIMFADDCRYGCREVTTTGQKHEIESTLITNAWIMEAPSKENSLPEPVLRVSQWLSKLAGFNFTGVE
jgi:hypothetical protein